MLGLDPLTVANEGKLVASVARDGAQKALEALRRPPGGERTVEMPCGEELPRIC